jgi:hypothetical protein
LVVARRRRTFATERRRWIVLMGYGAAGVGVGEGSITRAVKDREERMLREEVVAAVACGGNVSMRIRAIAGSLMKMPGM